jgi:hypothetical protein
VLRDGLEARVADRRESAGSRLYGRSAGTEMGLGYHLADRGFSIQRFSRTDTGGRITFGSLSKKGDYADEKIP